MQGTDPNPSPWEKMPPHPPVGYWCAWCYSNPRPHLLTTLLQDELSPIDLVLGSSNVKRTNNLPVDVEAFPPTARGFFGNFPNSSFFIGFCLSSFRFHFLLFRRRHLELSFLIAAIHWIGTISIMSKRSPSSVPTAADRARLKRRMEPMFSRSDSSSEAGEGSDCDLMAPLPLSCVYAAPPLVGPASSVEERASSCIPGKIAVYEDFFDSGLRGSIPALIAGLCNLFEISPSQLNLPAWRILIASQNLGDLEYLSLGINEVMFAYHLAPLNGGEGRFHLRPRSGLPIVEELPKSDLKGPVFNKKWQERYAFMVFPGSSHRWNFIGDMSGGVTNDPFAAYQEAAKEVEVLKCQVSGEKEQRVAREFEIHDLKEKVAEASSADALAMNQKNQELEEDIEALKEAAETFKFEMVMAVNRARVVARWELMREWLRKKSAQWDLVMALEQYKAVVQEEARSKGAPLPTFEDELAIPPSSDRDVDSSVKLRGSPT
ncbi:hypothetical protein F2Q68_00020656 [Brassica cretica]|uniref:Uncharacterized protein n=1 Tax=Brassica cretica TaxID=69181 RepID=A0A8S9FWL4_BRACR|nr:hypothetical protein F2Q68_00020656 [Brassica cretica]